MIKYKKFIKNFILVIIGLLLFHFTIWNIYTKYVFPKSYLIGDLGRMSYQIKSLLPRKITNNLSNTHIESYDYNNTDIDIIVIGDSFSNGGGSGKNTYYEDYISTYNHKSVLNIQQLKGTNNYIESILVLLKNNLLDKMNIKYVLIETVEREAVNRFTGTPDFNITLPKKDIIKQFSDKTNAFHGEDKNIANSFISNLNINALKYNIMYHFNDHAFSSNVYKYKLNKNLFTCKEENSLLFYKDDIKHIGNSTKENIKKLNDNFNKLAVILKQKDIKLYFMPVVDKYNLYEPYISNNKYQKSTFFEYLRVLPKEYTLIDTKDILCKELNKGVKDLYYPDDTHWSYKASEAIFKKVKFE